MTFEQNNNGVLNMNTPKNRLAHAGQAPQNLRPPVQAGTGSYICEVIKFFLLAVIVVAPVRFFIAQPFIVQGASMDPTFATGQYLIIDEITYRFDEPMRGDVIVLRYPKDPKKFFIKRIVGLPGDTLTLTNGVVSITTEENLDPIVLDEPYVIYLKTDDDETITLEDDEYFVMGDNRAASLDSRTWGVLPKNLIVGRAMLRLFPINTATFFPGFPDKI